MVCVSRALRPDSPPLAPSFSLVHRSLLTCRGRNPAPERVFEKLRAWYQVPRQGKVPRAGKTYTGFLSPLVRDSVRRQPLTVLVDAFEFLVIYERNPR